MKLIELLELGFNRNEALVYLALIKFGKSDANTLIRETKFHKNIVYDNLEKLIDKGLVSFVTEHGKKVFQIAPPNMLVHFFEEQEKIILEKKRRANILAGEIEVLQSKIAPKRGAEVFRGAKGIRAFYEDSFRRGNLFSFGAPKESVEVMGEVFWENYEIKRATYNVFAKYIFNSSLGYWKKHVKSKYTQIKYFDRDFEPLTETHVQGERVAIIVWTEEPFLFLIKDRFVADSYMKFFENMWKIAKR